MSTSEGTALFEAFFWFEPTRANVASNFKSTRTVWHYPEDVSHVTSEFRDIPQFCFPGTFISTFIVIDYTLNFCVFL